MSDTIFQPEWKVALVEAWRSMPRPFRNEHSVRRTLQCSMYVLLSAAGHEVVADYLPPRVPDRAIDLIVVSGGREIVCAVCIDIVVTLPAVKSLSSFEASEKLIVTVGLLPKKVQESTFFLKPGIEHMHLQAFETPSW